MPYEDTDDSGLSLAVLTITCWFMQLCKRRQSAQVTPPYTVIHQFLRSSKVTRVPPGVLLVAIQLQLVQILHYKTLTCASDSPALKAGRDE